MSKEGISIRSLGAQELLVGFGRLARRTLRVGAFLAHPAAARAFPSPERQSWPRPQVPARGEGQREARTW